MVLEKDVDELLVFRVGGVDGDSGKDHRKEHGRCLQKVSHIVGYL
jgi:hypothetical protein